MNKGTIADVVLSVGGSVVEDVSAVPFEYAYVFAAGQSEGELEIILTVRGDSEEAPVKSDTVVVTVVNTSVNIPQEVEVSLALPGGDEWVSDVPLVIKGSASVNVGVISSVTLTVGGNIISDVSEVPFEYSYAAPADLPEGNVEISLEVVGDTGASDVETLVVLHEKPEKGDDDKGNEDLTMTDSRDGKSYRIVTIGSQTWMAENLRYMPKQHSTMSETEPRYYVMFDYSHEEELGAEYLKTYGAFYNLPAVMQGEKLLAPGENRVVQGICPDGWHVPSQAEWDALARYVLEAGMAAKLSEEVVDTTAIAKVLASQDMWMMPLATEIEPQPTWVAYDLTSNNAAGFNGKPVGFRACYVAAGEEVWMHACYSAGWWSCNAAVQMTGLHVEFGIPVRMWSDLQTFVTVSEFNPEVGLPVRCLKD